MSELMDRAVIGMPFDMAMQNHLSRMQFYNRAQAILAERDALLAERDTLKKVLEREKADHRAYIAKSGGKLRAAMSERDAAFAAGQEDMRERAAADVLEWGRLMTPAGEYVGEDIAADIRDLPIKDSPDGG